MTDSQNDIGAPRPAGEWVTTGRAVDTCREEVFNEVILGLTVLMKAEQTRTDASLGHWRGIDHALAYVKAMVDQEA